MDLFYTNLTSCNFLVMLYVPFIIVYFEEGGREGGREEVRERGWEGGREVERR